MPGLGGRFREAREARGLTLSEVAEQIRIRSVYLAAIEDENWPAIGAPIYVRGFLRTYARFLALSPEEAVAQFNAEMGDREVFEAAAPSPPRYSPDAASGSSRRNLAPILWIASIVAVLLIGYVIYGAMNLQNRRSSAPQVSVRSTLTPLPAASPLSSISPSPGPNTISILAVAPTWMRITVDGSVVYEGVLKTGSVQAFRGKTAVVRLGNAGGAQITIDGKPLGLLGKPGQVVDKTFSL